MFTSIIQVQYNDRLPRILARCRVTYSQCLHVKWLLYNTSRRIRSFQACSLTITRFVVSVCLRFLLDITRSSSAPKLSRSLVHCIFRRSRRSRQFGTGFRIQGCPMFHAFASCSINRAKLIGYCFESLCIYLLYEDMCALFLH